MRIRNSSDCFDPNIGLLPVTVAESKILEVIDPLTATEIVPLTQAMGRVLARPVIANIDVPPHANSAMDGFALAAHSLPIEGDKDFKIVGTALAGKPWTSVCGNDETVRVMTGAIMPKGTDTVVIQEQVTVSGDIATISYNNKPNQNVRLAGEDLGRGEIAMNSGVRLGGAELGVIASTGAGRVEVSKRPVAGVFSTGDELRNSGESLTSGTIYDSNRFVLIGLLQNWGVDVVDFGIIPDNEQKTAELFSKAKHEVDLIITSGGVSTGSADFVIRVLEQLGEIELWRIAMRPGRPFAFGKIDNTLFFGLPGNPVAVMITFYRLVQPALLKLMGIQNIFPVQIVKAKAKTRFRKKPNRCEIYRAVLSRDENDDPIVSSTGSQGSGLLSSMSHANCFVILNDDDVTAEPGDWVDVQLFQGFY